jgi:hypothetical protein
VCLYKWNNKLVFRPGEHVYCAPKTGPPKGVS